MNVPDALRNVLNRLTRRTRPYDVGDAFAVDGPELDRWLYDRDARGATSASDLDEGPTSSSGVPRAA